MEQLGNVEAIKRYFGQTRSVENKEILELRKSMSKEDWERMAKECCVALGAEYKPN